MPKKLLAPLISGILAIAAFAAAPAHASKTQESIFQDDRALIFSGDAKRQAILDEIKALGATTVHSLVFWNSIAPDPNSKTKPAGFDGSDPNAYPAGAWDQYDALVKEATQSNWLYPQREKVHGHIIPTAAVIYRNLFRSATAALQATGHGGDQILLAESAPLGRTTGSLPKRFLTPVQLYQGIFCLDSRGHKLRGRIAKDTGCSGSYAKLAATGIAHHPYNRGGSQPPTRRPTGPGEITVANLSRLSSVINRGARAHRIRGGLKSYFTEFGFKPIPPDPTFG